MEEQVWSYITERELIREGQTVGAATSGGPDSMSLLVCLRDLAARHGFSVVCVHFEHGIRGEASLRDAQFVSDFCAEKKIPFYMGAADVPALAKEWRQSTETAARTARENYFNSLAEDGEVDAIATAHHKDDNAESILMHILRGSGLSGLAGIRAKKGRIVRPFLCVSRAEILRYAGENGVPCVTDETNADPGMRRNYVRNVLLPEIGQNVNPGAADALLRLSALAARDEDYLEGAAAALFAEYADVKDGKVTMDAAAVRGLHPAIAGRLIRMACARLHVVQDVELAHVEAALRLAKAGRTGARASLSANLLAQVEYGEFSIGFKGREVDNSFDQPFDPLGDNRLPNGAVIRCEVMEREHARFTAGKYDEYLDAGKLPQNLRVRTRRTGDVIRPLGAGEKKLKDYFIDKKLTRAERAALPLLADGKTVLWAVGHAIGEQCRVDEGTVGVLQLQYRAKDCENGEGEV